MSALCDVVLGEAASSWLVDPQQLISKPFCLKV